MDLKDKYDRVRKEHPRVDLKPLDAVKNYVIKNDVDNNGLRASQIAQGIGMPIKQVNRCLRYLVESGDLHVAKGGQSRIFFSKEKKDGTFDKPIFDRETREQTFKDERKEVINAARSSRETLDEQDNDDLKKVVTINEFNSMYQDAHNRLVDKLWKLRRFDHLVKLSLKSTANRYSR